MIFQSGRGYRDSVTYFGAQPLYAEIVMPASDELVTRKPRLAGVLFRALFITLLLTLLSFAVSLLLGILGTAVAGTIGGQHSDMANAYRHVALPVAAAVAGVVFVAALVNEFRRYRQRLTAWRGF